MKDYWKAIGNSMAMTWDIGGSGMEMLIGVRDADGLRNVISSPAYQEWTRAMAGMAPGMDVEINPTALEHRGISVLSSVTTLDEDAPPNPMMPDGQMTSFAGIAGDYLVSTSGGDSADIKGLIDRALDGKIMREKLPSSVFARMTMNFADFLDAASQGMAPTGDMPETVKVSISNEQGVLQLNIAVR